MQRLSNRFLSNVCSKFIYFVVKMSDNKTRKVNSREHVDENVSGMSTHPSEDCLFMAVFFLKRTIFLYIKSVIFKCHSTEKLIALNTLHAVVPTWY